MLLPAHVNHHSEVIWKFEDSLDSEPQAANQLVREVVAELKKQGWPEGDVFAVHMALEEALMNAIKHGNAGDNSKQVEILIQIREESIYAQITDQGEGFDPDTVPDPCTDTNVERPSGRGVALIKNFVDFVEYNAAGNAVEFTKTRTANS